MPLRCNYFFGFFFALLRSKFVGKPLFRVALCLGFHACSQSIETGKKWKEEKKEEEKEFLLQTKERLHHRHVCCLPSFLRRLHDTAMMERRGGIRRIFEEKSEFL